MFAVSLDLAHRYKAGWYSKNPPKLWNYSVAYFEEDHRRRAGQASAAKRNRAARLDGPVCPTASALESSRLSAAFEHPIPPASQVKPVEVHDLRPSRDKVLHKFLAGVVGGVKLRDRAQLGV